MLPGRYFNIAHLGICLCEKGAAQRFLLGHVVYPGGFRISLHKETKVQVSSTFAFAAAPEVTIADLIFV